MSLFHREGEEEDEGDGFWKGAINKYVHWERGLERRGEERG
jgi:hypothetical protein